MSDGIRIKAVYQEEPDLRRLAKALIEIAIADNDTEPDEGSTDVQSDVGSEAA